MVASEEYFTFLFFQGNQALFLAVTELLRNAFKGLVLIRLVELAAFLAENVQVAWNFLQYFFPDECSFLWRHNVCVDARFQQIVQEHLLLPKLVIVSAAVIVMETEV